MVTCLFGKENFWMILSPEENMELSEETRQEIENHLRKIGFSTVSIHFRVAVPGLSPLAFTKLTVNPGEHC